MTQPALGLQHILYSMITTTLIDPEHYLLPILPGCDLSKRVLHQLCGIGIRQRCGDSNHLVRRLPKLIILDVLKNPAVHRCPLFPGLPS